MSVLVEMDVGGVTRYYSRHGLVVDDRYYEPRLRDMPPIDSSIGSPHAPRHHDPRATLRFADGDDWPATERFKYLADNNANLSQAVFRIYQGSGDAKTDFTLLFTGRVNVPGGLVFFKGFTTVDLVKQVHRRNRGVPHEQFGPNHASGCPEDAYIPRVFGDYSRAPAMYVPTIKGSSGQFFVADPDDITSISAVKDGDGNQIAAANWSYADGIVTVSSSPLPDEVFVSLVGAHGPQTADDKAEHMARWLIRHVIGDPAASIDETTLAAMGVLTRTVRCRAYFGEQDPGRQPQAIDILHRLISQLFYDLVYTQANQYKFVRRSIITGTIERILHDYDFLLGNKGQPGYTWASDPDKVLANRIHVNYALDPETERYTASYQEDDTASQARLGSVLTRTIECPYFLDAEGPSNLGSLYLAVFGSEIYNFTDALDGLDTMQPGDQLYINTDQLDNTPVQVRTVRWDLLRERTEFEGFALLSLAFTTLNFAPADQADWGDASAEERQLYAFFTDADGENSGSKFAPGGRFTPLAYAEITARTTDDPVTAAVFNQAVENIKRVRLAECKIPYGSGTDYMGVREVVDDSVTPPRLVRVAKANTEPTSVTLANAEQIIEYGETSTGPSF